MKLTDDRINELWVMTPHPRVHNFARAIEAEVMRGEAVATSPAFRNVHAEKLCEISRWISEHVQYDAGTQESPPYPASQFDYQLAEVVDELNLIASELNATPPQQEQAASVPDGFVLVPKELTREMIDAYVNNNARFHSARSDWTAMIAAAPKIG